MTKQDTIQDEIGSRLTQTLAALHLLFPTEDIPVLWARMTFSKIRSIPDLDIRYVLSNSLTRVDLTSAAVIADPPNVFYTLPHRLHEPASRLFFHGRFLRTVLMKHPALSGASDPLKPVLSIRQDHSQHERMSAAGLILETGLRSATDVQELLS